MRSIYKILWSKRAYNNLSKTISYLENEWSEKEVKKFAKELDRCLNILRSSPEAFPLSKNKTNLRKAVVTKHNILYYKFDGKVVKLVNIFDSRQHPEKI